MILESEFIYLANRSNAVFLQLMAKDGLRQAIHNKRAWEVATAVYAKNHPGNGQADDVQHRAVAHLAALDKATWKMFRASECRIIPVYGFDERGVLETQTMCAKHGEEIYCNSAFGNLMKETSY